MSTENTTPETQSSGDRFYGFLVSFLRTVVRLILIVFVAVVIGVAIYLAVPRLYDRFVQPIEQNSLAIEDLQARHAQEVDLLTGQLAELQSRVDSLELQNDQDKELLAATRSQMDEMEQFFNEQIDGISVTLVHLDDIDASLAVLEGDITRLDNSLEEVSGDLAGALEGIDENHTQLETLEMTFSDTENPLNSLRRELQLVKVMELITRVRVSLGQQNLGLAEEDLQLAIDTLTQLQSQVPPYQTETIEDLITRLSLVQENITENPNLVENDLEAAWQLLVIGLPGEPLGETSSGATPTPTPTPSS